MPLKKQEVESFKQRLLEIQGQMSRLLRGASEEFKKPDETAGYSQHQADQGTDDFDRTISLELTGNELEILKQVDRALEKIEDNTYGKCDVTGDDIPVERLRAVPYATMTVKAQEMLEKGLL